MFGHTSLTSKFFHFIQSGGVKELLSVVLLSLSLVSLNGLKGSMQRSRGACWACFAVQRWIEGEDEGERGGFERMRNKWKYVSVNE